MERRYSRTKNAVFFKILMPLFSFIVFPTLQPRLLPLSKNTIILGSIQFSHPVDREIGFSLYYKGKEYVAKVETSGDTRKAHFELYEEEKPNELYILITDYLALPENPTVQHLYTSAHHTFRLFKLVRTKIENLHNQKVPLDTWTIEEITSPKKSIIIPDNTIIIFWNPDVIEKIQPMSWSSENNIVHLPVIKLKETLSKDMLYELADKMKLTMLDFKFLHKKENLASIPYANNRMLSMPFTTRRSIT